MVRLLFLSHMRTIVYVDGFNLYYGCLKDTSFKWLDIPSMCAAMLPNHEIVSVKYYTARVASRPSDPGQAQRQDTFLRALGASLVPVEIVFGHFISSIVSRPLADAKGWARVIKYEEKGSDVNLGVHLVRDAFMEKYHTAVVVSNDSDLAEPVRIVTKELQLSVGILSPTTRSNRKTSATLIKHATFVKPIWRRTLHMNQLPNPVINDVGTKIFKPSAWR